MKKLDDFNTKAIDVNVFYKNNSSFKELYDRLETYDKELLVKSIDNIVNDLLLAFIVVTTVLIKKRDLNEN